MNVSFNDLSNEYQGQVERRPANISQSDLNSAKISGVDVEDLDQEKLKSLKRSGRIQCKSCAERKYKDGSNESDVSFKAAGHIDPGRSAATVMSHEMEHVANAHEKAAKNNGKVMSASIALHTSICPECGRSYVSGGLTTTSIKYSDDEYSQNKKSSESEALKGNFINYAV